jgi:ethanolamine phosphate transferase 2 subunit G
LQNPDWEAWIMHYLGLDHIGHKSGPNSPNMIPKQHEMDGIVREIYTEMSRQPELANTLLVLCGDHGMNEGGNHGGSAPGETSPALVFMSPKLKSISGGLESPTDPSDEFDYYTKIEQSDVAPTIAGLLGFPVPLNNLGVFIPDFLELWEKGDDKVQLLLRNAKQILSIVKATFPHPSFENPLVEMNCDGSLSTGMDLACRWRKVTDLFRASGSLRPPPEKMIPLLMDVSLVPALLLGIPANQ